MRGFYSIPSVVQIWLAQMIVLLFLSDLVIRLVQLVFRPPTGILKTKFDWFDIAPWTIGALCLYWLMRTIWAPKLGRVTWRPAFQAGPAVVWRDRMAVHYSFPSTHPSYVFMDALAAGTAFFIYWLWSTEWQERRLEGILILALGLLTPVSRLVAWFVFGLRPRVPSADAAAQKHEAEALRQAWRPVFFFYAILIPIFAVAGGLAWHFTARDWTARIENAIRITPENLARPRFFEEIRDTGASQPQSKLARITIASAAGTERCEHATVKTAVFYNLRATYAGAEIMLTIAPAEKAKLDRRAAAGGAIELLGILVRPPAPHAIPQWRAHVYCTLPRAQRQPRWIFEVEQVLEK